MKTLLVLVALLMLSACASQIDDVVVGEPTIETPVEESAPTEELGETVPDEEIAEPVDEQEPEEQEPAVDPLFIYEEEFPFGFVGERGVLEPVWDNERQGYTPNPDDTREQLVIDESFSVRAGEEVVFENQIVWVRPNRRGDIEVYGTLIVNNSILLWDQTEHQQTRLVILDGGKLFITDSYAFLTNQYWDNWDFEDGSTIRFDGFVGDPWCSIDGSVDYSAVNYSTVRLTLSHNLHDASIAISDSHYLHFELYPPAGEHELTFPRKLQWTDWDLSDIWPNTSIVASHSYLRARDISINNNTHVTIIDTPSGFGVGWAISNYSDDFVNCEFRDFGDPDDDEGIFYEDMIWDLPCNNSSLTVKNSLVQRFWPVTWGKVHLKVYDSNLIDPRNLGGPATFEIYDSTIDQIAAYQGGRVYLENCKLRYDIEVKDEGSVIYSYGLSGRDEEIDNEIIEVDGGVYIELESPGPPW